MADTYELYQDGRLMFVGDQKYLAEMTGLSESTITNYSRPGYFDGRKNETKLKFVKVKNESGESE